MIPSIGEVFGLGAAAAAGWSVISVIIAPAILTWWEKRLGRAVERGMEEFRYGVRVKEQAARTAEYLALGWRMKSDDDASLYRSANQIGWELALYLPTDLYLHVRDAIDQPSEERNVGTAIVAVRAHLLGNDAGSLGPDDIMFHVPDAKRLMAEQAIPSAIPSQEGATASSL